MSRKEMNNRENKAKSWFSEISKSGKHLARLIKKKREILNYLCQEWERETQVLQTLGGCMAVRVYAKIQ